MIRGSQLISGSGVPLHEILTRKLGGWGKCLVTRATLRTGLSFKEAEASGCLAIGKRNMISKELLEILACPACDERPPVRLSEDQQFIVCDVCGRRYPVKDDIPVMLVEEAILPDTKSTQDQ